MLAVEFNPAIAGAGDAAGQGHPRRPGCAFGRGGAKGEPVAVKQGVAIDKEESVVEPIRGERQRAGRSGEHWFDGDFDPHTANRSTLVGASDVVRLVAAEQEGPRKPVAARLVEQIVEKGPTADLQHRLGGFGSEGAEARACTADENDDLVGVHRTAMSLECLNRRSRGHVPRGSRRRGPSFPAASVSDRRPAPIGWPA